MTLDNFTIITRPNKWLEPNWYRSFYDVINNSTGKKYRFSATDINNRSPFFINVLGEDAENLASELSKRENKIQELKNDYLDKYNIIKQRHENNLKIPKEWFEELKNTFEQMHDLDVNIGNFAPIKEETDDSIEGFAENANKIKNINETPALTENSESLYIPKQVNNAFRAPEVEAPHNQLKNIKNNLVEDDDYYEGMNLEKTLNKCIFLIKLSKDGDASSAGCVPSQTAGYINPTDNGYRNILFSHNMRQKNRKKGKNKKKVFMKAEPIVAKPEVQERKPSLERGECPNCGAEYQIGFDTTCWNCGTMLKSMMYKAEHDGLRVGGEKTFYDPNTDTIQLGRYKLPWSDEEVDAEDVLDKLLHEEQHKIQMSELSDKDSPDPLKPESKRQVAGRAHALDMFADVVPLVERDSIMAQTNPKSHPNYKRFTEEQKKKYDPFMEKAWKEYKKADIKISPNGLAHYNAEEDTMYLGRQSPKIDIPEDEDYADFLLHEGMHEAQRSGLDNWERYIMNRRYREKIMQDKLPFIEESAIESQPYHPLKNDWLEVATPKQRKKIEDRVKE